MKAIFTVLKTTKIVLKNLKKYLKEMEYFLDKCNLLKLNQDWKNKLKKILIPKEVEQLLKL